MNYQAEIVIDIDTISMYNRLLDMDYVYEGLRSLGYDEDKLLEVFSAEFSNGYFADIRMCSGQGNFFCDPVLFDSDGYEVCCLDCSDTLNGCYFFEDGDDTYELTVRHNQTELRKAIAIDFDGTLCEIVGYPKIGAPITRVIEAAKKRKANGYALILWTCREGEALKAAIKWCGEQGLVFDAINESLPEWREKYGWSRKVGANEYWDERGINPVALNDLELGALSRIGGENNA